MRLNKKAFAALMALLASGVVHSHGGRLDASGGHTNRKTGEYHYHRGGESSAPPSQRFSASPAAANRSADARPFANCAQARAAGAAPVLRGDPRYGPHLDRDGDGSGCEPYRGRR